MNCFMHRLKGMLVDRNRDCRGPSMGKHVVNRGNKLLVTMWAVFTDEAEEWFGKHSRSCANL